MPKLKIDIRPITDLLTRLDKSNAEFSIQHGVYRQAELSVSETIDGNKHEYRFFYEMMSSSKLCIELTSIMHRIKYPNDEGKPYATMEDNVNRINLKNLVWWKKIYLATFVDAFIKKSIKKDNNKFTDATHTQANSFLESLNWKPKNGNDGGVK